MGEWAKIAYFAISGVLPKEDAIYQIKKAIEKTYGKRGAEVVRRNYEAVDQTLAGLVEIAVPDKVSSVRDRPALVSDKAPDLVQKVTAVMLAGKGDLLPVSAFPVDGTWPVSTTKWEKRNIATEIPVWDPKICIQCNQCALVCPHAAIRAKVYEPGALSGAPATFKSTPYKGLGNPQPVGGELPIHGPNSSATQWTLHSGCRPAPGICLFARDHGRLVIICRQRAVG